MALSRRDFLIGGIGGLAGAGAVAWWRARSPIASPFATPAAARGRFPSAAKSRDSLTQYGHGVEPPSWCGQLALDPLTIPPPYAAGPPRTRDVKVALIEQKIEVAHGQWFNAWTFNGGVPGPVLRATEGDTLRLHVENRTARAHNMHFHGSHDVAQDGWEPLPPGGTRTYEIAAAPFGLHPFHCDATPVGEHVSHGLFGSLIVDPRGGRPPAVERVLVLCGFDTDGDGKSDLFAWNGAAGFYERFPLKVPVGQRVRLYLLNMVADEPVASFHLHAESFDVYPSGTSLRPSTRTDVVTLAHTERAIVEFTLPKRGRYMFHPHQAQMAERGAMGWIAAL